MRIAVKVGTSTLCENGALSADRIWNLVDFLRKAHKSHDLLLVSSGAVAAGHGVVESLSKKITAERQALAAIGQAVLMNRYATLFEPIKVAQILLNKDNFNNPEHAKNMSVAIETLLARKILPIINENDTVVIDELLRGDNDQLSAKVAHHLNCDLLIILTDIDGYYDKNPRTNSDAKMLKVVRSIEPRLLEQAAAPNDEFATGGIVTKLKAADYLMQRGKKMFLASGFDLSHALKFINSGEYEKGTLFLP